MLGRDDDVDTLWDRIRTLRVHLLDGARGVGKSTLLEFAEAKPSLGWVAVWVPLDGATSIEAAIDVLRSRIPEVDWWRRTISTFFGQERDPLEVLDDLLTKRPGGERLALLLDEVPWWLDRLGTRQGEVFEWLGRLDRRLGPDTSVVLTGSVGLRPLARQLGVPLGIQAWTLPPVDRGTGEAIFVRACRGACDNDSGVLAWREAGGLPRWIERLGQQVIPPYDRLVSMDDVEAAIDRIVGTPDAFAEELHHLRRYGNQRPLLERALTAAAEEHATEATVAAAIQQLGAPRAEVGAILELLRDDQYFSGGIAFRVPLLRRWLRRHRCR